MSDINKRFTTLRFLKSPMKDLLLQALEYVKHFMIKRGLILVGGMSIDCSLRLKNLKLYGDDEIPDYDMYSPSPELAYLLGHELCEKKFPSVDVITAIHTTTMRVRVDGNVVADITYMPPRLFEKLRTQEYQGMKIVHPYYNMMDQFRSMSGPYENPPNEVIAERWTKDIDRFNMLIRAYPLDCDKSPGLPAKLVTVKLPEREKNTVIGGWIALAWHLTRLKVASTLEFSEKNMTATIPVDLVTLATTAVKPYSEMPGARFFNALFSYPRHILLPKMEIFDFYGERMTVCDSDPRFASLSAVMYYFLHTWLLRSDPLSLVGVQIIFDVLREHPLVLDITPLGEMSWNTSTLYSIANILNYERVKSWKPQPQLFCESDCAVRRTFDTSQSPLFAIDESEVTQFENIVETSDLQIISTSEI